MASKEGSLLHGRLRETHFSIVLLATPSQLPVEVSFSGLGVYNLQVKL